LKFGPGDVRELAAEVLGQMNKADAVSPLTVALKDQNKRVRLLAVRALRNFSSEEAIKALIIGLKDPDGDVQQAAEKALIKAGPRACDSLRNACDDDDAAQLKSLTAEILDKIENAEQTIDAHDSLKTCERCNSLFKTSEQDANEDFCGKCLNELNEAELAEHTEDVHYSLKTCPRCNSLFEAYDASQALCKKCINEQNAAKVDAALGLLTCEYCNKKFKPKNKDQRFCSQSCSSKAGHEMRTKREELVPAPLEQREGPTVVHVPSARRGDLSARQCEYCKKEFKPHGYTQRFCSLSCLTRSSKGQVKVHKSCLRCGFEFESGVDEELCSLCNFELNKVAYLLNKGISRKFCESCNKEYYPTGLNQRFCSTSCSVKARREMRTKREVPTRRTLMPHKDMVEARQDSQSLIERVTDTAEILSTIEQAQKTADVQQEGSYTEVQSQEDDTKNRAQVDTKRPSDSPEELAKVIQDRINDAFRRRAAAQSAGYSL
jgi:hypothetical protein